MQVSHKNGITCNIAVSNEEGNRDHEATEDQILDMIQSAIDSVLDDEAIAIETTFCYKSNCYKLSAQPSKPEHLSTLGMK